MFGVFTFGRPTFGDAYADEVAPTPSGTTYQSLVLDCRVRDCATLAGSQGSDFTLYNLATATVPVSTVPCRLRNCETITGVAPVPDLQLYDINDALQFNGTPLTVLVECPPGYYCPPGLLPPTITFPPGNFPVVVTPPGGGGGGPTVLSGEGCLSLITIVLPPGATPAQITAAGEQIVAQMAAQQAECDAIEILGPGNQTPVLISLSALSQYACINVPFAQNIVATATPSRAPYNMLVTPQPSWMVTQQNLAGTTLLLSGTPTSFGAYSFTGIATGNGASGTRNYTINVVGIATASPLATGQVGVAYSEALDASSIPGVLTWSISSGALPAGLTLNASTGEISGTPTTEETGNFTVSVSNGTVTCSKAFTLEIGLGPCVISTSSPLPDGVMGTYYSQTIAVTNLTGTPTWSVIAGAIPSGLTLDTVNGVIEGLPTEAATGNFTLQVTNGVDTTCSKPFDLEVTPFDCGVTPAAIQDLVWTTSNPQAACGSASFSGGSGTWDFTTTELAGPCQYVIANPQPAMVVVADICNPGAPYLVTVTFNYVSTGTIYLPPPPTNETTASFIVRLDNVQVGSQAIDLLTDTPNPAVIAFMLPTGFSEITLVCLPDAVNPAGSYTIASTGATTLSPLTPP